MFKALVRIDMPKKRTAQPIQVWLSNADRSRLDDLAKKTGRRKSDLAREAICKMLDNTQYSQDQEQEAVYAAAVRKMEDRIAGLIARTAIDVGTIYQVLWHRSDPQSRQNLFTAARNQSIDRLHRKLKNEELTVKQTLAEDIRKQD